MPTATVYRIDPNAVEDVLNILRSLRKEFIYDKESKLGVFINSFEQKEGYIFGSLLIDRKEKITVYSRDRGKIIPQSKDYTTCEEVKYAYFKSIKGSGEIPHAVVTLGSKALANLFSTVIGKLIGRDVFLSVRFNFTRGNEQSIRNQFDDIIRLRGEDLPDAFVYGMHIRGTRLYDANEYQKIFTGEVKVIGVVLESNFFLLDSSGKITTYKKLTEEQFISFIKKILSRLIASNAIII